MSVEFMFPDRLAVVVPVAQLGVIVVPSICITLGTYAVDPCGIINTDEIDFPIGKITLS
jgi:hypothetical protein